MVTYTTVDVLGFRGKPVPNTLIRQEGAARHLCLIFPGFAYSAEMPLLYYPGQVLAARGADVLRLQYAYHENKEFQTLSPREQARWIAADAVAAADAGLAQRVYEQVTLIGKSIGTLAMGHLLAAGRPLPQTRCIWLTPLLREETLRQQIIASHPPSLFVQGTSDPHYDATNLAQVADAVGGERLEIPGADHSLEIPGDVPASIQVLEQVVRAAQHFLG